MTMKRAFIHDDFLLESDVAAALFHEHARDMPIVDFHCHLSPEQMAANHRFRSLTEIWLDGDHYKWRAMRTNGVAERYCTGDATDWEKFEAWAATVPETLRNPLFHWTQLELKNPFGIEELLGPATARPIYERCNELLRQDRFTTLGLLEQFKVGVVCTTDDPTDSLEPHAALARRKDPATQVFPTWRPDRALAVEDPAAFNAWVERLEGASGVPIGDLGSFLQALQARHDFFHERGCRASDHGLEQLYAQPYADAEIEQAFSRLRAGRALDAGDALRYKSALLHRLALLDHARGWVQQFHLGAMRNNNSRLRRSLGPDTGFDSIGDFEQARPLARFLDRLDQDDRLARTILFNLNPADNELFATMIGNFQDGSVPGKLQLGTAWWFLDQKDGMEAQLRALSNLGLLSRFVGMVTDSRSFLSYSRHEYFRRLLCNLLGEDVRRGLLPDDRELLGRLVRRICFENARDYFGFPLGRAASQGSAA
jgi:glucuronate isomerase